MSEDTYAVRQTEPNGGAMAALLAAGIGAFAVGLFVILHEAGLYSAPSLYAPAGGVTGRTGFAVAVWLLAWALLHFRWKGRQVEGGRVHTAAIVLVLLGLVLTFPPIWTLL